MKFTKHIWLIIPCVSSVYAAEPDLMKTDNGMHPSLASEVALLSSKMVTIPSGDIQLGCVSGLACDSYTEPLYSVSISSFRISQYETTNAQWNAVMAKQYQKKGDNDLPVISVSWEDVQVFIKTLNKLSGRQFRLPSEAEWEYAARAGTKTVFHWGNSVNPSKAHFDTSAGTCGNCYSSSAKPVGYYEANQFGLYDMHGNAQEWVQDCYGKYASGTPKDGTPRELNCRRGMYVVRGGSYADRPARIRSGKRLAATYSSSKRELGFRLAESVPSVEPK